MLSDSNYCINNVVCVICHDTLFLGVTSKLCGHTACEKCFGVNNFCPICKTTYTDDDLYKDNTTDTLLKSYFFGLVPLKYVRKLQMNDIYRQQIVIDRRNLKGETLLHKLCKQGKVEDIEFLLYSSSPTVNIQDYAGWTPFHEAVIANHLDVVRLLLNVGIVINAPGMNYKTALHIAVEERNIPMVKILIAFGASVSSYDSAGKTPMDLCHSNDLPLMEALCRTPRNQNLHSVFTFPKYWVVFIDVNDEDVKKLSLCSPEVTVLSLKSLENNKNVNYVVIGNPNVSPFLIQMAILQGVLIFEVDGFLKFVNNRFKNPLSYCVDIPGYANCKAAMNKLRLQPRLFDSLHFYYDFNYGSEQLIGGFVYQAQHFKTLVIIGGGKLLARHPRDPVCGPDDAEISFPYHSDKSSVLAYTTNYVICSSRLVEFVEKEISSGAASTKYKTLTWFINCINNFCIK